MVMFVPQPYTARALGPFSPPSMAATWAGRVGENPMEPGENRKFEKIKWKVNIYGCLRSQIWKMIFWGPRGSENRKISARRNAFVSKRMVSLLKRPCKNQWGRFQFLTQPPNWMGMCQNFRSTQTTGVGELSKVDPNTGILIFQLLFKDGNIQHHQWPFPTGWRKRGNPHVPRYIMKLWQLDINGIQSSRKLLFFFCWALGALGALEANDPAPQHILFSSGHRRRALKQESNSQSSKPPSSQSTSRASRISGWLDPQGWDRADYNWLWLRWGNKEYWNTMMLNDSKANKACSINTATWVRV